MKVISSLEERVVERKRGEGKKWREGGRRGR